jgi:hypothetical protein
MGHVKSHRSLVIPAIAALLGAALTGATVLTPATQVALAQTEPMTAANGVLLPPLNFDPVATRNEMLTESAVVPTTSTAAAAPTDESTGTDAPDAVSEGPDAVGDAPGTGDSTTTSLGGSDVAVSSVGGSYEVDRPNKRSDRKK